MLQLLNCYTKKLNATKCYQKYSRASAGHYLVLGISGEFEHKKLYFREKSLIA